MCRSKAQGGQRCHAHAAATLEKAASALGVAALDLPSASADREQVRRYREALIDYATTARGAANLWPVIGTYPAGHPSRRDLERVFYKAVKRRQAREDAYTQWKRDRGQPTEGRDMLAEDQWAVTDGARCARCGQYTSQASTHTCPTRLTMLPVTAPSRFASRADGRGVEQVPMLEDLPEMDFATAQAILSDLSPTEDFERSVMRDLDSAMADDAFASPGEIADGVAVGEKVRQLISSTADSNLEEALFIAHDGGGFLDSDGFDRLQSHLKADTAQRLGERIHRLDPAISPARAEEIADQAMRSWAMNYSHDKYGEQTLAPYHQAAEALAAGRDPLAGHALDSPEYEAGITVIAQYQATQEWFADRGVTEVRLHRGMAYYDAEYEPRDMTRTSIPPTDRDDGEYRWVPGWIPAEELEDYDTPTFIDHVRNKPLSSWSDSEEVAGMFAEDDERSLGYILATTMPVQRILSIPRTGNGCLIEREVVVLDGPGGATIRPNY